MTAKSLFALSITIFITSCFDGGSSSGTQQSSNAVPVSVSIKDAPLSAGVPSTFTYGIPAPTEPYTDITVDLAKTLESASISVTPSP